MRANVTISNEGGVVAAGSNTITSGMLTLVRDYLLSGGGDAVPQGPIFISLGDGALPAGGGKFWVTMSGERNRLPIVLREASGGSAIFSAFVASGVGGGGIMLNAGLWGGEANLDRGTGTLLAHANLSSSVQLLGTFKVTWTITVAGSTQ